MSTLGEQLTALREEVASRRGWGPRTIGRLSTRRALSGIGATDDEALLNLRTRIQEGSDEG